MDRYVSDGLSPKERYEAAWRELTSDPWPVVEVGIPMRDGVVLAADIYLPQRSQLPVPAVVTVNTGYDKSNAPRVISPLTGKPDSRPLGFESPWQQSRVFQQAGYAFVINDERGRGKSGGGDSNVMRAGMPAPYGDGYDGYDVIEWVARQPWCNGKVGTTGGSMLGNSQYTTAYEGPPSLACMVPAAAGGYWLTERNWVNGCYVLFGSASMAITTRGRLMHNYERYLTNWRELLWQLPLRRVLDQLNHAPATEVLEHDRLDEWWQPRMIDGKRAGLTMPTLHIAGWLDQTQLRGVLKGYEDSRRSPAKDHQYLVIGPWTHGDAIYHPGYKYQGLDFGRAAAIELNDLRLDWFAHWLQGDTSRWTGVPKVNLFETGSNVWRSADNWPLPNHDEALFLNAEGQLTHEAGADTSASYLYDPENPVMPVAWERLGLDSPIDQAYFEGRHDVLRFTTPELTSELAVCGWPRLTFHASTDGDDTEWHLRLTDVHPDGRAIEIARTCLRASYRESLSNPEPLVPGQVYEYQTEFTPITHAFLPGHRIGVSVTSSDFPNFARSLNRFGHYADLADGRAATNTLYSGLNRASRLVLPVTRGTVQQALRHS